MTRITTMALGGALVLGMAPAAFAQSNTQTLPYEALSLMDANGDGVVTSAEMQAYGAKKFTEFDKNRNGSLNPSELPMVMGEGFAEMDGNSDGRITRDEFLGQMNKDFVAADQDGDGILN